MYVNNMKIKTKLIRKFDKIFRKSKIYKKCKSDYNTRVLIIFILGLFVNFIFALLNTFSALYYSSLWFSVFAGYYFLLSLQKLMVFIVFKLRKRKCKNDIFQLNKEKIKIYLANGIWFVPIDIILAIVVAFMIGTNTPTQKDTIMAIASATYAFTKIGIAIRNIIKARSNKDLIIQTIRNIGFVDALTSILVLEITLISTFGVLDYGMKCTIGISGFAIFILILALGLYMIINGKKKLSDYN